MPKSTRRSGRPRRVLRGVRALADDVRSLNVDGRITVIGTGAGAIAELNLLELMAKRGRIHGSTLRARNLEEKAAAARAVEKHVLPTLTSGQITVPIESTFPMAEAAAAYEHFKAGPGSDGVCTHHIDDHGDAVRNRSGASDIDDSGRHLTRQYEQGVTPLCSTYALTDGRANGRS